MSPDPERPFSAAGLRAAGARLILALLVVLPVIARPASAQEAEGEPTGPVALIADVIDYSVDDETLTARGNVEVYLGERTLTADTIVYDSSADRIRATGPLVLRAETGDTLYADAAELDADLRDGLIRGARAVIANGAGKLSAAEAERVDDRFNVLLKAVYSPCEVCLARPTPLWRIRAEKIIHDEEARQIHYQDAYFDVLGVPLGYLPYFRHPDPTVDRATGFLAPEFSSDGAYGFGLKTPYYFVLDETSDFTLAPFVSTSDGAILETEYRRRFETGFVDLEANFGATDYGEEGKSARPRLGGFGVARYGLGDGVHTGFDLALATDDAFLRRYDYTTFDRLDNEAFIRRYDGPSRAGFSVGYTQSLREGEAQDALPLPAPEFSMRHVAATPGLGGGELGLMLDGLALVREEGRDVGRLSFGADWSRSVITTEGLVLRGFGDVRADVYETRDDSAFDGSAARLAPRIGVEARMPFVRAGEDGASHVLEPIAQLIATPGDLDDGDIPNEDSLAIEFDTHNLFETDRFTGFDRVETGAYANLGARYERIDPAGIGLRAAGGTVIRFEDDADFSDDTGLTGARSDYVGALSATYRDQFEVGTRLRLAESFEIERAEVIARTVFDPIELYGSYLFIDEDPRASSFVDRSEALLGGALRLDRNWRVAGEARRDLESDGFESVSARIEYRNECAGFELFANRRFTETDNVPRSVNIGLRVRLFGTASEPGLASGACAYGAR